MCGKEGEILGELAYFAFMKPHYELVEEAAVREAEAIANETEEDLERPHKKQKVDENSKQCYCTNCHGKLVSRKTHYNHNNQPASSNLPLPPPPPPHPQVELQQDPSCTPDIHQRFQIDFQDQEEGHDDNNNNDDDDSRYQEVSSGSGFEEEEQVPAVISHQFRFESQENQQKQPLHEQVQPHHQSEEEIEPGVAEEEPVFPVVINQQELHHQQEREAVEAELPDAPLDGEFDPRVAEAELPDAPSDGEGDRVGDEDDDENEIDLGDDDDDDPEDDGDENDDEHPMEGGGGLLEFLGQQPDLGFDPKDPNCINRVFTSLPIFFFFFFWIILLSDQK